MSTAVQLAVGSPCDAIQLPPFPVSLEPVVSDLLVLARKHASHRTQKIPVVGVGGCPGVGKTIIAHLLAQQLKRNGASCVVIRFDDWTNPPESRKTGYFDLKGVHGFFRSYLQGLDQIEKPVVNEFTDEHSREVIDLKTIDLILFEGLLAISGKEPDMNYFRYCDRGIFIEAAPADIEKWKRERPARVSRTEEEFSRHMKAVFAYYRENIEPFQSNAAWVIQKGGDHSYRPKMTQGSAF